MKVSRFFASTSMLSVLHGLAPSGSNSEYAHSLEVAGIPSW